MMFSGVLESASVVVLFVVLLAVWLIAMQVARTPPGDPLVTSRRVSVILFHLRRMFWCAPLNRFLAASVLAILAPLWIFGLYRALDLDRYSISGVIVSATAAFGGAYFAFLLAERSRRRHDAKQFQVEALEKLEEMFRDVNQFGRVTWESICKGPFEELNRLSKRTSDVHLRSTADSLSSYCRTLKDLGPNEYTEKDQDAKRFINEEIQYIYSAHSSLKKRIEDLLLDHFRY